MIHSFDTEVAKDVGIYAAVIIHNLFFWCKKNEANEKNYHHGTTWTYNSVQAFGRLFPYIKKYSISKSLTDLEEQGYIISGNFNKIAYDRTKWYAVTDKTIDIFDRKIDDTPEKKLKSIDRKLEMGCPKTKNGNLENGQPIPDFKKDSKNSDKRKYISPDLKNLNSSESEDNNLPETNQINPPEKKIYSRLSENLKEIVSSINKITLGTRTHQWPVHFRKLCEIDKVPVPRIREVLRWYADHIGEEFVPECFSAESFRTKFNKLESAMTREKPKKKRTRITNDKHFGTVYGGPDLVINNGIEKENSHD